MTMNGMTKRLLVGMLAVVMVCAAMAVGYAESASIEGIETVSDKRTTSASLEEMELMDERMALWTEMVATYGEDMNWPLEVFAEYSQRCQEQGLLLPDSMVYGLPAEDEVQLEDAMKTANSHLLETMGYKEEMLDKFSTYVQYVVTDPQSPTYRIAYNPKNAEEYEAIGAYLCILDGKSGEVLEFLTPADAVG